ncbi:IS66 family insertion sequence element accessory protein TnpB [Janthinobacterium fluminis]|uniref:IS66 family insertion sequence element accessory protein TnpB n=1 Tax=Janthinobacterium fluminis TaxID=2987524 RepID=A0ABT5K4T3_9BURK|nr:IS66 family insertion sequence element accessory protein TnpB [Janthinobacterium fluminis]MDC8759992.1 IS66 family insertion sequence element accessory protein TnpB [Janthinobacterium fluminis]
MGIDVLSLRVQQALGKSSYDGSAYAFHAGRANRLKLLIWDGTGVLLYQRRLHQPMLTVWRSTQPAASVRQVIGHWLGVLADIEADTKAVLNTLVSCR